MEELFLETARLLGRKLKSAHVSWFRTEDGTDHRYDLVMRADSDWDQIEEWEDTVLDKILEWADHWTESEQDEYSERIFHSIVSSSL